MNTIHLSPQNILLLIVNIIIMVILVISFFKIKKRERKLLIAINHFNIKNGTEAEKKEYILDTAKVVKSYPKKAELIKLVKGDRKEYFTQYYSAEIANILAIELLNKKAIQVEFIEGVEEDTIIGTVKYVVKI